MSTNNTSQSQYRHIYDTSDTHHAHPYTKTNTTDGEHHKPVHAQHPHHLPLVIPDLRFERSYLNSIASHVHVKPLQGSSLKNSHEDDLDFASASATDGVEYSVVDWRKVAWITMRDQMISPLVQGAVWGFASQLIIPFFRHTFSRIFKRRPTLPQEPRKEGEFTKRMREWSRSLTARNGFESGTARVTLASRK